jgi:hypothetical protein
MATMQFEPYDFRIDEMRQMRRLGRERGKLVVAIDLRFPRRLASTVIAICYRMEKLKSASNRQEGY